jgi:hypothetical protein
MRAAQASDWREITRTAEYLRPQQVVRRGVTVSRLSAAHVRPVPPGSDRILLRNTPLYDALVDEYRLALRSLPGDRSGEDMYIPRFAAIPHQCGPGSRHRGASGDMQFRF